MKNSYSETLLMDEEIQWAQLMAIKLEAFNEIEYFLLFETLSQNEVEVQENEMNEVHL